MKLRRSNLNFEARGIKKDKSRHQHLQLLVAAECYLTYDIKAQIRTTQEWKALVKR